MRIKNRLFPYPILNNNKSLSDYTPNTNFELCFDRDKIIADKDLCLKNVFVKSNDNCLNQLLEDEKIKGALIVECSNSIFRKKFEITNIPQDINIPIDRFSGNIEISAFIYAAEDINEYDNPNYLDDYMGYKFKIEKYCIIAADDGFTIKVENQPEIESKKSSIFTIVCDRNNEDNIIRHNIGGRKIIIYLPEKYYNYYNSIKRNSQFLNASFATIAIPVLTECIMDIQTQFRQTDEATIEDIYLDNPWFRSVCNAYMRERGKKLDSDQFREIAPTELAQIVLNYALCNGINDIYDVVTGIVNQSEDEDNE